MGTPLINSTIGIITVVMGMITAALLLQNTKFGRSLGAPLLMIILGIILMNTHVVPAYHDVYGVFLSYAVPLSMSILLMNVDIKSMLSLSKQPLLAMCSAVLCVSVSAVIFGVVFSKFIPESWRMAGMFVGTYTGGSANLTAIAYGLDTAADTIAAANAADYVIGMPLMMILFALPAFMNQSQGWNRFWPYRLTDEERADAPGLNGKKLLDAKEIALLDIGALLFLAFCINICSGTLSSMLFSDTFVSSGKILILTTVSILIGQIPFIKKLKGKLDIGIFVAMFYYCVIGFLIDIKGFMGSTLSITVMLFFIVLLSFILHVLVLRLMKIKYEYALVSITAGVAEGTSAAMVASNGGWMSVVTIGVVLGALGAALGNYFGLGVAYLVKAIIGA